MKKTITYVLIGVFYDVNSSVHKFYMGIYQVNYVLIKNVTNYI
jgi:hypothetical protein